MRQKQKEQSDSDGLIMEQLSSSMPASTQPTSSSSSSQQQQQQQQHSTFSSNSSRKRKRGETKKKAPASNNNNQDVEFQQQAMDRYRRLLHACTKDLHKQAKVVKSFQCQKMVRLLKKNTSNSDDDVELQAAAAAATSKEEERWIQLKAFDLNVLVQEALRRLGILNLQPQPPVTTQQQQQQGTEQEETPDTEGIADDTDDDEESKETSSRQEPPLQSQVVVVERQHQQPPAISTKLVEKMLQHKRMQAAMEQWNDKVTDYRRWLLRARERKTEFLEDAHARKYKNKTNATTVSGRPPRAMMATTNHGPLFVQLGGGVVDAVDPLSHYGPASHDDDENDAGKKNRPGQRARKAKAMAMEAKKQGKTWDSSLNWRAKKPDTGDHHHPPSEQQHDQRTTRPFSKSNPRRDADGASHPTTTSNKHQPSSTTATSTTATTTRSNAQGKSNDAPEHPSWVAKQAQKKGIVEFKGTKITFT
jgi:hypothetical protein